MKEQEFKKRLDALLAGGTSKDPAVRSQELFHGTLNIMILLYGPNSIQVKDFRNAGESIRTRHSGSYFSEYLAELAEGALRNIKAELEAGLIGSLQKTITGDVLTDFLQLARAALSENNEAAKNVAAVLTAGLFEDTIRRIAISNGMPHIEKLQEIINELKNKGILQGPQVGIANSYLSFRNKSLHAQWDQIERESVASVLGFVEQLLLKHFP